VLEPNSTLQIELQPPLKITSITQDEKKLIWQKDGYSYFIELPKKEPTGTVNEIVVYYEGNPKISKNPPWSGGITWQKDGRDNHFIATSCQGDGASLWWPCKDHMYDEVDSMLISVTVPKNLMDVSNGVLRKVEENEMTKTYHWFVNNPINNYGVNINIGDYVHFGEIYEGEKGELACNYYVLRGNLELAKEQFKQVPKMLEAFEHWFGAYPFYEDGFKLVEVPYLGMEHQSSVTYGNGYKNGYRGRDLSMTGIGLLFDFIIVHEAGHEWFANNITYKDVADMWIHESFTTYSESLYLEYHFGKSYGLNYTRGTRTSIANDIPIIGVYDVNHEGSGDMYYKGANMLVMIRQVIDNDKKWRKILRGLNQTFYHQTVTTKQIEDYMIKESGKDLQPIFNQYLRDIRIPTLEYRKINGALAYRFGNCVEGFKMPLKITINGKEKWINASQKWSVLKDVPEDAIIKIDPNFYIGSMNIMGN
jgi:aminopeptidase N